MADLKTSDLPEITTLAGADIIQVSVDTGGGSFDSNKITVNNLKTELGGGADAISSEGSNANGHYRVWNSGFIQQWGVIGPTGAHTRVTQTMPVSFTDVSSILPTLIRTDGALVDDGGRNVDSITISSIGFINSTAGTIGEMRWSAQGY